MDKKKLYQSSEFIERYLSNQLSPGENKEFEAFLEIDNELKQEILLSKSIQEGMVTATEERVHKEMSALFEALDKYDLDTQLDDYILGHLSYSHQVYLEELISRDENLQNKLTIRRAMFAGLRHESVKQIEGKVQDLLATAGRSKEVPDNQDTKRKSDTIGKGRGFGIRKIMGSSLMKAASVLLLITFGILYSIYTPEMKSRQSQLALTNLDEDFQPLDRLNQEILNSNSFGLLPKKRSSVKKQRFEELVVLMNNKEYRKALAGLEQFREEYGNDNLLKLYLGIVNFELGEYSNAKLYLFDCISNNKDSRPLRTLVVNHIPTIANWYLALTFLHLEQPRFSKKFLGNIQKLDAQVIPDLEAYQMNARLLLEDLR